MARKAKAETRLFVGTSGYSYPKWKGSFYPAKLPQKEMLSYYASQFATVEANGTFYKLPSESAVAAWAPQTPASFRFAIKAPQPITHFKRLKEVEAELKQFLKVVSVLKERCGPLFFQLPPNFKKDLPRFDAFLSLLDGKAPCTFEFRHNSWFDDEVYACLRSHGCALCAADTDEKPCTDLVSTANWGYVRLRRTKYTAKQLSGWIERIKSQNWREAYVYFMHEDTGTGPKFAKRFLEMAEA